MMGASRELAELGSAYNSGGLFGFRNRIINGDMRIDQRNAGASVTPTDGQFSVDRWRCGLNQASKFSIQQSSVAPIGFTNSLLITSLSAYSIGVGDLFLTEQRIEGFNFSDLGWGTANAQTVTLSFWVRSSLTGTFGGSLRNSDNSRSYPFSYAVSAANTWEQKAITVAGDTTGTWVTNNGTGAQVTFGLGVGSNLSGAAGSWAAGTKLSATGAVSVVGTNGATLYVTGVNFEKGSTATSFDYRPYGTELALCQRYLPAFRYTGANTLIPALLQASGATSSRGYITFPVTARTAVTGMTISSAGHFFGQSYSGGGQTVTAFTMYTGGVNSAGIDVSTTSGWTARDTFVLDIQNSSGYVYFTGAEL